MGRLVLGMALTLTASACAAPRSADSATTAVSALFESTYCGVEAPRVAWLGDRRAVLEALARARRNRDHTLEELRRLDFSTHSVVGIWMGAQPTGGYSLQLAEPAATAQRDALQLRLRWQVPSAAVVTTQALTSPCLLVTVPRGDYLQVQVVDQSGQVRGEVAVP